MKKYITINYYSDRSFKRKKELLYCVQKNLNLSFIYKVIVFSDKYENLDDLKNLKNYKKLVFVDSKEKLLFKNIIEYCQNNLPKNSILIHLNLDNFLENNRYWKNIDRDFFQKGFSKKTLVCHRTNLYPKKMSKLFLKNDKLSIKEGDFCDAIVMTTPIDPNFINENLNFSMSASPGADPLVMGLMTKYYHVYHWGIKYKTYHFDVVNKQNEFTSRHFHIIKINTKIDSTPLMRSNEAVKIPINQDWKNLLKKKIRPNFIYIKKRNENFIKIFCRKIYIYIIINYKNLLFKISRFT